MSEQNEGMSLGDLHDWGLTLVEQPFARWLSATDGDFKNLTSYDQIPEEETKKGAGILDSEIVNVNLEGATLLDRDVRDSRSAVLALVDSVKGESRQELLKYAEEIAYKNETFFYWLKGGELTS